MRERTPSPVERHKHRRARGRHREPSRASGRAGTVAAAAFLAVVTATTAEAALIGGDGPSRAERAAEAIVAGALAADQDWAAVAPMTSILPQGLASSSPVPGKERFATGPVLDHGASPVAGLDATQMANAVAIIEVGMERGLGERAWAVALATAMQEAKLYNAANPTVPESYAHDWEVEFADHDSVGVFQQRPSMGWGTIEELMDVPISTSKFYGTLEKVEGWEDMSIAQAAQAVQISAFPDYYAQWEDLAWDVIDAAVR